MKRQYTLWLLVFLYIIPFQAEAGDALRLAILSNRPKVQTLAKWRPLTVYLENALQQRVELNAYNHAEMQAAVEQHLVDVVLTSPAQYIVLKNLHSLSAPLVSLVSRAGDYELEAFGGVIIARADDDSVSTLSDLSSKRIAYVSKDGLGGYLMQAYEILDSGHSLPAEDKLVEIGLPQDNIVAEVRSGRVDAGFIRTGLLEKMQQQGELALSQFKIINPQQLASFPYASSTRLYPEWPLAVMPHISDKLSRRLAIALLSLQSDSRAARSAGIAGFSIPSDYAGVENVMRELHIAPFDAVDGWTVGYVWQRFAGLIIAFGLLLLLLVALLVKTLLQSRQIVRNEKLFRILAETVPVGVYRTDANGLCIYVNDKSCEICGFTKEEAMGTGWSRFVHADDRERIFNVWMDAVKSGKPFSTEFRFQHPSGKIVWVYGQSNAELNNEGKVIGYIGTNTDITQLKEVSFMQDALIDAQAEAGMGLLIIGSGGKVVRANKAMQEITGYTPDEITSMHNFLDLVHPFDRERVMLNHQRRMAGETFEKRYDMAVLTKSGEMREVDISTASIMRGAQRLIIVVVFDITERKRAEERLQLAASVFSHAREGIMITDADGLLVEVNDTFTAITGYSRDEVIGQNPRLLKSGRQGPAFYNEMVKSLKEKGSWSGEAWNRRKDGNLYAERISISTVLDQHGALKNYVALFTDITELKQQQAQLEHLAHFDGLTGLPNRMLLSDRMQQDMAKCQRRNMSMAVVYLDLDGFKSINDLHGHDVGDELLIAVSKRMKSVLRDGDTLARIGGDEFVAVLVDLNDPHDCDPVLERLLRAAADPIPIRQKMLQVSASIGVTLYPLDGVDADVLVRHADQAMYQAKQAGKNRYYLFDIEKDVALKTKRETLDRIQQALNQNEFVLYYQPKVNMKTGRIIGAEALIRWQHPEKGILPPITFLPAIEGQPLSIAVGEWVIKTALVQMNQWQNSGFNVPVSVNISADHLMQDGFVERLRELMEMSPKVTRGSLELEVLETSALEDIRRVSAVMNGCREFGIRFALDDFGTGYSSLTYLKQLPAEVLKIDQSFVREMTGHPDDLAIVEGVLGLAVAFQREAIAEGVETEMHGEMLLPLGCENAQGYAIARPMPAAELPGWAASWKPFASWQAWNDRPYNRNEMAVVYAEVEHRYWINQIEAYISNKDDSSKVRMHQCHFSRWAEIEGRKYYSTNPSFQTLLEIHNRIHQLGFELMGLYAQGLVEEAHSGLRKLHEYRESLVVHLRNLYGMSQQ